MASRLACALFFAWNALAPAVASELTGNVHFAVHAEKSAYEPNEPVYLLIDVFNAGATALSVWTGCCTYQVVVHGPGIPLPDSPRTDVCACPGSMIKLEPGRHFRERLLLNAEPGSENPYAAWLTEHYRVTEAGRYTIKLDRHLGGSWLSAKTTIDVVPRIGHQ